MLTKIIKNNYNIINFLIALVPISYTLGNLILSLNTLLIIIMGIFLFKFEVFVIKRRIVNYLIYFFFFYVIFVTIFNNIDSINESELYKKHIIKSFLYLRYLLLFLLICLIIFCSYFIKIHYKYF